MRYVILLALVLRVAAWCALPATELMPDEQDYLSIADSIVHEGTFRSANAGYHHARGPVYCVFLALAGPVARPLQMLLDATTAGLLVLLAASLGMPRRVAIAAGVLWAVNPFGIYFSQLYLSESLYCFLLLAALVSEASALLGFLILTRSIGLGTTVILLWGRRWGWVAVLAIVLPWLAREYEIFGRITLGPQGNTLWESLSPAADGGPGITEIDDGTQTGKALRWSVAHPGRVLELAALKQLRFWSPVPNYPRFRRWPWLLVGVYELPLLALGVAGAWRMRRRHPQLVAVAAMYPAAHLIILGSVRYRMPIEPLLCLFSASWWKSKEPLHHGAALID